MQTHDRRNKNVQFTGFNLLNGARVHFNHFGELLLCDAARDALSANIRTEHAKFRKFGPGARHALMGRHFVVAGHRPMGRNQPQGGAPFQRTDTHEDNVYESRKARN